MRQTNAPFFVRQNAKHRRSPRRRAKGRFKKSELFLERVARGDAHYQEAHPLRQPADYIRIGIGCVGEHLIEKMHYIVEAKELWTMTKRLQTVSKASDRR